MELGLELGAPMLGSIRAHTPRHPFFAMDPRTVPFRVLAEALLDRIPKTSSSQLDDLRRLGTAIRTRCDEIERLCAPKVRAPRPAAGDTHALEEEAPALPPLPPPRPAAPVPPPPAEGTVMVVAGNASEELGSGYVDGESAVARFCGQCGIVKASDGSLLVVDKFNHCIRKVRDGQVTTLAGNGEEGEGDGEGAGFSYPQGAALDSQGGTRILVADWGNFRIAAVTMEGAVSTLAEGLDICDIAVAPDGTVVILHDNRLSTLTDGAVAPLAGRWARG